MIEKYAPIILFVFNKPKVLLQTLNSLSQNIDADKSTLYIFSDGISEDNKNLYEQVKQVRKIIRYKKWCKKVEIIEYSENQGIGNIQINGLNQIFNIYEKAIIIEDDCYLSPYFIRYMNLSLNKYEYFENVMHISGYFIPNNHINLPNYFFMDIPLSWGWSTWRNKWQKGIFNSNYLYSELSKKNLLYIYQD